MEAFEFAMYSGLKGMNITAPFKEEAYQFLKKLSYGSKVEFSGEAEISKAINTVLLSGEKIKAYNTDILALHDLLDKSMNLVNKSSLKVAILGAGGAARGVLSALSKFSKLMKIEIFVFNRTLLKADNLARDFPQMGIKIFPLDCCMTTFNMFDIVFNCLSSIPQQFANKNFRLGEKQVFIDANYKERFPIMPESGTYISGEEWLIRQALASFRLFTGFEGNLEGYMHVIHKNFSTKRRLIYLIGLPGSGKSTVGKLLAEALKMDFLDSDELIEERSRMSIKEIFDRFSEAYFRNMESEILTEISNCEGLVVSTGGGIILSELNRKLLQEGHVIWLWSKPEVCAQRLRQSSTRPLLQSSSSEEMLYKLKSLLLTRINKYFCTADLIYSVDGKSLEHIVTVLQKELSGHV